MTSRPIARRLAGVALIGACWMLSPTAAKAYLLDANDATTVDPGAFELEIQPIGVYYERGDGTYFVAPSAMMYIGLEPGVDLILLARGYRPIGGDGYSIGDTQALLRFQLRDGNYDGEQAGPSVVLQAGMLLPTYQDTPGFGLSYALLISQQVGSFTYHTNFQVDLRRAKALGVFVTFALEGPAHWPVRPAFEVYVDYEVGSGAEISALAGLIADLGDKAAVMVGARGGQGPSGAIAEGRLSLWLHVGP